MNKNSFSKADLAKIEKIQKEKGIKTFTEAVRTIVREFGNGSCSCGGEKVSDENFTLLANAIVELSEKMDQILMHMAPQSAGEVK